MGDVNRALWLETARGPFSIRVAPMPEPGPGEVVIRAQAVAVNPLDVIGGSVRRLVTPWLRYPTVLGSDVAGVVVDVGLGVTHVKRGDRVMGYAAGQEKQRNSPAEGAFQLFVVVLARVCTPLPSTVTVEQAAVLPLALSTAAAGLFEADQLGLSLPGEADPPSRGVVLVWGASTSVGCNAVQLARASGYTVLATAGPHNHDLVRSLGAEEVFDYRSAGVDASILEALGTRELVGTLAIGKGSLTHALHIARAVHGTKKIASSMPSPVTQARSLLARARGIRVTSIWGGTPVQSKIGPAVFQAFLPDALEDGRFRPAPAPTVYGTGLEQLPGAMKALSNGVSATKLVVALNPSKDLA